MVGIPVIMKNLNPQLMKPGKYNYEVTTFMKKIFLIAVIIFASLIDIYSQEYFEKSKEVLKLKYSGSAYSSIDTIIFGGSSLTPFYNRGFVGQEDYALQGRFQLRKGLNILPDALYGYSNLNLYQGNSTQRGMSLINFQYYNTTKSRYEPLYQMGVDVAQPLSPDGLPGMFILLNARDTSNIANDLFGAIGHTYYKCRLCAWCIQRLDFIKLKQRETMTHKQQKFNFADNSQKPVIFTTKKWCFELEKIFTEMIGREVYEAYQKENKLDIDITLAKVKTYFPLLLDAPSEKFNWKRINWEKQDFDTILSVVTFFLQYKKNAMLRRINSDTEMVASVLNLVEKLSNLDLKNILIPSSTVNTQDGSSPDNP